MRKLFFVLSFFLIFKPAFAGKEVLVKKGDTVFSLSRQYNLYWKDIIKENHLEKPYTLMPGQKLSLSEIKEEQKNVSESQKIKIQKGDTLYSLAKKNNLGVDQLAQFNQLKKPYRLSVGQELKIPASLMEKEEPLKDVSSIMPQFESPVKNGVVVQKGDTLYSLAKRHNVSLKDLVIVNELKPPYVLKPGDVLALPLIGYHIVQKGDTLYSISRKYNVDLSSLVQTNHLKEPYTIALGQKIILPTAMEVLEKPVEKNQQKKGEEIKKKALASAEKQDVKKEEKPVAKKETAKTEAKKTEGVKKQEEKKVEVKKQPVTKFIAAPPKRQSSKFLWPVIGKVVSKFGSVGEGLQNDGINIAVKKGTTVKAAENGVVAYAGNELKGLGNLLLIKHADGWLTVYAHNDALSVSRGDKVSRGQKIAVVGRTGNVSTDQLHFEVRKGTKALDPLKYLSKK